MIEKNKKFWEEDSVEKYKKNKEKIYYDGKEIPEEMEKDTARFPERG